MSTAESIPKSLNQCNNGSEDSYSSLGPKLVVGVNSGMKHLGNGTKELTRVSGILGECKPCVNSARDHEPNYRLHPKP